MSKKRKTIEYFDMHSVVDNVTISTRELPPGAPHRYETRVFRPTGEGEHETLRYDTVGEAIDGHMRTHLAIVRELHGG